MVSDGTEARIGTLTSGREWFKPWRTITGESSADPHLTEPQVMLEGVFEPGSFLSMIRDFIVFNDVGKPYSATMPFLWTYGVGPRMRSEPTVYVHSKPARGR